MQAGTRCAPTKGGPPPPHGERRGTSHKYTRTRCRRLRALRCVTYAGRGGRAGKTNSSRIVTFRHLDTLVFFFFFFLFSFVPTLHAFVLSFTSLFLWDPPTHPAYAFRPSCPSAAYSLFFFRTCQVVEDISPSRLTPREVQKIALLDMRILNRDRNSVNILVRSRPRRSCSFSDRAGRGGGGSAVGGANGRHNRSRHGSSDSNIGLSMSGAAASCGGGGGGGKPGASRGDGDGLSDSGKSGGLSDSSGRGSSRRSGGLLGGSTEYELIPIDHGLCLSNELVIDWCDWCWLNWRQVKEVGMLVLPCACLVLFLSCLIIVFSRLVLS